MSKFNILILGASYGSLLASKILFGGHTVKLVCLPEEANLINSEGFRVRLPVRGRAEPVEIDSRKLPGKVSAAGANEVLLPYFEAAAHLTELLLNLTVAEKIAEAGKF